MRLPAKSLPVFGEGGAGGAGWELRCGAISSPPGPLVALASTLPEDGEGFFTDRRLRGRVGRGIKSAD
jgi:hypothetical protein